MIVSKFADREKTTPIGKGFDFDGKPVRRCRGMIYWYRWGRHTFDIREMRKILNLPEDHTADKSFVESNPYHGKAEQALEVIFTQIRTALGGKSFKELIKEHDAGFTSPKVKGVWKRKEDSNGQ